MRRSFILREDCGKGWHTTLEKLGAYEACGGRYLLTKVTRQYFSSEQAALAEYEKSNVPENR